MYQEISKLILYRDLGKDSILFQLADIFKDFQEEKINKEELITRIYGQIKAILQISTTYGFAKNLWHNYLTFLLITNENPFSITCEKIGAREGTVNHFAKSDFKVFYNLFHFDFAPIEKTLGIDCFNTILNYSSLEKKETMYNKNVSEKVQSLSDQLEQAQDENEFFALITDFYKAYGVGMFGINRAFRINDQEGKVEIFPINNIDTVMLDDLIGYEIQKKQLVENTQAFVEGRRANNVLLYGDSGTGKSTSVKAIINEYYDSGLRMIEIYKHQFKDLSDVIAQIKNRNYRFIIFMDDLSFEEFEIEYKYLKAIIEGGVETKPDNVLIYATSNRRHLIRETWSDRSDMSEDELHHSDTVEEKLSLASRFGVTIHYGRPTRKEYLNIVLQLSKQYLSIPLSEEEICREANRWEARHGGISGRAAQQFMNYLLSKY